LVVGTHDIQSSELGGASRRALVVLDGQHVLGTLHCWAGEGNVDIDISIGMAIDGGTTGGHSHAVNDPVGETQQCELDIVDEIRDILTIEHNGDGSKCLIQSGSESEGEGIFSENIVVFSETITVSRSGGHENEVLSLVLGAHQQVISVSKDISSIRTHLLGAIDVTIQSVALALAGLAGIPQVVVKLLGFMLESSD